MLLYPKVLIMGIISKVIYNSRYPFHNISQQRLAEQARDGRRRQHEDRQRSDRGGGWAGDDHQYGQTAGGQVWIEHDISSTPKKTEKTHMIAVIKRFRKIRFVLHTLRTI